MPSLFTPQSPEDLLSTGYAGYIFDWDGTLADSHQANYVSMRDALDGHGVPMGWEWFNERTGISSSEMAALAASEVGAALDPDQVARERDERYLQLVHTVGVIEPVLAVLRNLRRSGLPVALATGGGAHTVLRTVEALDLHSSFDVIVTRDDAAQGKPAPDIFLLAASRLGIVPASCLVYEDSDQGLEAAANAGMDAIDVRAVQGRI